VPAAIVTWLDAMQMPHWLLLLAINILLLAVGRALLNDESRYGWGAALFDVWWRSSKIHGVVVSKEEFNARIWPSVGVAPEHLPRIFEAFQRLDSTRVDGLGIGLIVVRRAIELLGHRIEVKSAVSLGSRFSVFARAAA
jgi:histidine kinase/DNA gyrase B/HSP90-like ATPase